MKCILQDYNEQIQWRDNYELNYELIISSKIIIHDDYLNRRNELSISRVNEIYTNSVNSNCLGKSIIYYTFYYKRPQKSTNNSVNIYKQTHIACIGMTLLEQVFLPRERGVLEQISPFTH